ncbi:MAG: CopG family transcriptional regulator [Acidimicrobiaceae bacterium]|nr:CopG family transcriptional regulator [Acidimicrobiaceae bacterium]
MADRGIAVNLEDDPERRRRRIELGIPDEAASCHTAIVDGYVLEGHVPIQAIERLLADRPVVVGLAVPGMPGDSPGMGGDETTWALQTVLAVRNDAALQPFSY